MYTLLDTLLYDTCLYDANNVYNITATTLETPMCAFQFAETEKYGKHKPYAKVCRKMLDDDVEEVELQTFP